MRFRVWVCGAIVAAAALVRPTPALAWGDEGHRVIATVAQALLRPDVRRRVGALLAADPDSLTAHDIASEATWADHYREANERGARARTRQWHFVDIELSDPSLDQACFGHPRLRPGRPASDGPARDCVVDKIVEFAAELSDPRTDLEEQILALKWLLHLVGDVHQPLHTADDGDRGGNDKQVSAEGLRAGTLHHFWDTAFVLQLGPDPQTIATRLLRRIGPPELRLWARGSAADWAMESFALARDDAYGRLPEPTDRGTYRLPETYIAMADADAARQLSKAGVRLAFLLNMTLGRR